VSETDSAWPLHVGQADERRPTGVAPRREYAWLASAEAFRSFVDTWERGDLPKVEWTHAAHVAVGACYVVRHGAEALARIRQGIVRHNDAVGTPNTDSSGYHETLTRFWAETIAHLVTGLDDQWAAASLAVARFGEDRARHTRYYGFDVVGNVSARRSWVPPDLRPIDASVSAPDPL
jgi:hypothetical protein